MDKKPTEEYCKTGNVKHGEYVQDINLYGETPFDRCYKFYDEYNLDKQSEKLMEQKVMITLKDGKEITGIVTKKEPVIFIQDLSTYKTKAYISSDIMDIVIPDEFSFVKDESDKNYILKKLKDGAPLYLLSKPSQSSFEPVKYSVQQIDGKYKFIKLFDRASQEDISSYDTLPIISHYYVFLDENDLENLELKKRIWKNLKQKYEPFLNENVKIEIGEDRIEGFLTHVDHNFGGNIVVDGMTIPISFLDSPPMMNSLKEKWPIWKTLIGDNVVVIKTDGTRVKGKMLENNNENGNILISVHPEEIHPEEIHPDEIYDIKLVGKLDVASEGGRKTRKSKKTRKSRTSTKKRRARKSKRRHRK